MNNCLDWRYDILKEGVKSSVLPVPGQSVVYTPHFPIFFNHIENPSFCFEYKATSDGNVSLKIELEQSNEEPVSPLASSANWAIPDGALEFNDNLVDELFHLKSYPPTTTLYARLKITGLAGNDASTGIDVLKISIAG